MGVLGCFLGCSPLACYWIAVPDCTLQLHGCPGLLGHREPRGNSRSHRNVDSPKRLRPARHWRRPYMTADCRLPIADCRLPIADCRLPIAEKMMSKTERPLPLHLVALRTRFSLVPGAQSPVNGALIYWRSPFPAAWQRQRPGCLRCDKPVQQGPAQGNSRRHPSQCQKSRHHRSVCHPMSS